MQATNGSISYNTSPATNPSPTYVTVIQERRPSGMFAKILRNVESCPTAIKVGAVAIPVILTIATYLLLLAKFPADPSVRMATIVISLVYPIWGMHEFSSFVKEYFYQQNNPIHSGQRV